ncbi:hypothetical protein VaNZ11_006868, partial [Volvox africanus]
PIVGSDVFIATSSQPITCQSKILAFLLLMYDVRWHPYWVFHCTMHHMTTIWRCGGAVSMSAGTAATSSCRILINATVAAQWFDDLEHAVMNGAAPLPPPPPFHVSSADSAAAAISVSSA